MQRYTIVSKSLPIKFFYLVDVSCCAEDLPKFIVPYFVHTKRSSKQHSVLIIQVKCVVPKDIHVISSQHLNIKKICDGLNPRHPMIEDHAFVVCLFHLEGGLSIQLLGHSSIKFVYGTIR